MISFKEILDVWFDKTVPYPNPDPKKLQGQCVQFIRYCLEMFYEKPQWYPRPGAADFWDSYDTDPAMYRNFDKIPNTQDFIPKEGDICIWNKNKGAGYGHIGIVYGQEQNIRMMTCLEQNWKPLKVSVVTHNYNDVIGFLRVKK
jgi:hypothetical protein